MQDIKKQLIKDLIIRNKIVTLDENIKNLLKASFNKSCHPGEDLKQKAFIRFFSGLDKKKSPGEFPIPILGLLAALFVIFVLRYVLGYDKYGIEGISSLDSLIVVITVLINLISVPIACLIIIN
ncbi:MAG: hypothetical protein GQ579_05655 [Bacteroidales bacterium]|nr:hypothetical protein [Bacteroidales bacterium]